MVSLFHTKDLRAGRYSKPGYFYLITSVTKSRKKVFLDFNSARILINALKSADDKQYTSTIGFVVMPDHFHWLITLKSEVTLSNVVKFVKGTSSFKINRLYPCNKFSWQRGFHDHTLRRNEEIISVLRYVIANPLRAGLVHSIGDYSHWDCVYL